ncbi:MAG: CotH kinase family protein [Spirochaetales bacterium]|nr:CotH kinase family protein [Spirochaetales bacterium]
MGGRCTTKIVAFILFTLLLLSIISSCGEFIGFAPLPDQTIKNIPRADFYLSENHLKDLAATVLENFDVPCIYEIDNTRSDAFIKVMGSFSRLYPKKSFILRLKDYGVRYAFEAAYDYFLTNRIALYGYSRAGLFSPSNQGVAFYINNQYIGCYTRITMYGEQDLANHYHGVKGELFKAFFNDIGNDVPLYYRTEKKFPKDNDFTTISTFISNAKYLNDREWNEWVRTHIDTKEVITYLVVHNFLAVEDTSIFNFYIYNYGKLLFLPWDNEISMKLFSAAPLEGNNLLTRRLLMNPDIRDGYNTMMRRLFLTDQSNIQPFLQPGNPDSTENIIDDLIAEVERISLEIDRAIYYEPTSYFTYQDFIDEKNNILTFLNTRSYQIPDPVLP